MPTQVHDLDRSQPDATSPMERAEAERLHAQTLDQSHAALLLEMQRMAREEYERSVRMREEADARADRLREAAEKRSERLREEAEERANKRQAEIREWSQKEAERMKESWALFREQQETMLQNVKAILDVAGQSVASSFENIARARETAEVLNKPRAPQPTAGESAVKCVQELVQGAVQIFSKNPALMERFGGALAAMTGEAEAEADSGAGSGHSAPAPPAERAVTLGDIAEANAMIQEFEKRLSSDQLMQLAKRLGKGELELTFAEVTAEIERLGAKTGTAS